MSQRPRKPRPFVRALLASIVVALLLPTALLAQEPPLIPTWSWEELPCDAYPSTSYNEFAMQVDDDGRLHIVCFQEHDGSLYYVTGTPGNFTKELVDAPGQLSPDDAAVGGWPSLVLDAEGRPHIAYLTYYSYEKGLGYFGAFRALRYGVRTATGWELEDADVASPPDAVVTQSGTKTALALRPDGTPLILYHRWVAAGIGLNGSSIRQLLKFGGDWVDFDVNLGTLPINETPALVSAPDGRIHATFTWYSRETGKREGVGHAVYDAFQWKSTLIEKGANAPLETEIAAAADGRIALAYTFDQEPLLRPLRIAVLSASGWTTSTVAMTSFVYAASLTFDGKGQPALALSDWGRESLTYVELTSRGWVDIQVRRYYDMGLPEPVLRYHGETAYLLYRAPREGVTLLGTRTLQPATSAARLPLIMQGKME